MWRKNAKKENKHMLFSYGIFDNNEKSDWVERIITDYNNITQIQSYNVVLDKTGIKTYLKLTAVDKATEYINSVSDNCDEKISPKYIEDLMSVRKNLKKVKGYCVKVTILDDDSKYYLFGGVNNFNYLKNSKVMSFGNITDTSVKKLTNSDQIIGILPITTCLITNNFIFINKRKKFEDLFGLLDTYKKEAKLVVDDMSNYSKFYIGVEQLKKDIEKKPIYARTLVNFKKHPERLEIISNHIEDIKKIKESDTFKDKYKKLQVTDEGIVYDTSTMSEFLSILNEKPVKSLVTKEEFLAERDEEE